MASVAALPDLPIQARRIQADLEALAAMTDPQVPYTRLAFTPLDKQARDWLVAQMEALGLRVRIDPAANIIGRRQGADPAAPVLMTGSHIDTVMAGGRFDGMAGIAAALEVVRCLNQLGYTTRHPLEVVSFTCEEATVLGLSPVGSRIMANDLDPAVVQQAVSPLGVPIPQVLAEFGGDASRLHEAHLRPGSVLAQVELHIEQGPELEERGIPVGVVTGIAAPNRARLTITGSADHAGATLMPRRRDALTGAAEVILAVERVARELSETVGTVGSIHVHPNQANVVPGQVVMSVEVRSISQEAIQTARHRIGAATQEIARRRGLKAELQWLANEAPVVIPQRLRQVVEASCRELGIPFMPIVSRASHDSARLARVVPVCMVFVPSRGGKSHAPEEWTDYEQIATGTRVLGRTLLKLDQGGER